MFDPVEYWKRRKDGKRGQGDPVKPVKVEDAKQGEHMIGIGGKMQMVNRATARKRYPRIKDSSAEDERRKQRAAKHAKRNAGEHERALKKKEKANG